MKSKWKLREKVAILTVALPQQKGKHRMLLAKGKSCNRGQRKQQTKNLCSSLRQENKNKTN